MTLPELLACDAAYLERMTDAQLLEHFKQYLDVTRPERARQTQSKTHQPAPFISPAKKKSLDVLASMGLDMDLFKKKGRR